MKQPGDITGSVNVQSLRHRQESGDPHRAWNNIEEIRMRVLGAVAMIALLAGPAYAQQTPIPRYGDLTSKTPKQIEEERAAEKAYKKSLGNIPDQTTPSDPWGNARSASEPKAAAKTPPAKPQAKAGSATK